MQNSGLGNCINTLGPLNVASQIPVVLVISHRGDLGEFNPAQVPWDRRPTDPDALGIRHVMPRSIADLESMADGPVRLCYTQSVLVAFILPADDWRQWAEP
jgi:sulfopyruvate decarboxylase subunit alpha